MKKVLRESMGAAALGVGGTVLVLGVGARLMASRFWLADMLVNFQVHFIVCLLVNLFILVLLRRQLTAVIFLLGTLFLALPVIPYVKVPFREVERPVPTGDERVYRLLTYNVMQDNTRTADVADFIANESADFVLLIETDSLWEKEMEFELKDHFPHRFAKPRNDYQGLLFLSKHPWESIRLVEEWSSPAVEASFNLPEGPLRVIGVHPLTPMRPPMAATRNDFLQSLGTYTDALTESVIVAGDFNVTPWSPHFQRTLDTGRLQDSALGRGLQNTWYRLPILLGGLPIDHVVTRDIAVRDRQIGPPIGSDHRPIIVNFLVRSS